MINLRPGCKKLKWHKQQKSSEFAATYNHSQNIWDKFLLSCGMVHYGKSSISVFQIFTSTDKISISQGGISTRQKLY